MDNPLSTSSQRAWRASLAASLLVAGCVAFPRPAAAFDFAELIARARKLAAAPYVDPGPDVPEWLREISYDQWRDIRFRPDRALWSGSRSPFRI